MILKMYSVYDRKSEIHQPPCYCHNTGHAMRVFSMAFHNGETNQLTSYPEDFQLFEVGSFDDQDASIAGLSKPHLICSGTELMNASNDVSHATSETIESLREDLKGK
jgi:hypothetical protein